MQTFETDRLLMRQLRAEDQEFYCACYTDPTLMRHIALPLSRDAALRSFTTALKISSASSGSRYAWVIQEKQSQVDVGLLGLARDKTNVELGHIMLTQYQNRGYTIEAINALIDVVFHTTDYAAFLVTHRSRNSAVIRTVKKLGFLRNSDHPEDNSNSCWILPRNHWQALRAVIKPL